MLLVCHELDSARVELVTQRRELLVVEIELRRLRLQRAHVDRAVVLGGGEELLDGVVFENGADRFLLVLSGCDCAGAAPLESIDAVATHELALDAGVRRMTVRADIQHELGSRRAGRELVAARATANGRQYEVRVSSLHVSLPS